MTVKPCPPVAAGLVRWRRVSPLYRYDDYKTETPPEYCEDPAEEPHVPLFPGMRPTKPRCFCCGAEAPAVGALCGFCNGAGCQPERANCGPDAA